MNAKVKTQRDAQVLPQDDVSAHPEAYWCVVCGRAIAPEQYHDENVYVHDDIPHPEDMTFDEQERPQ